jgi:hypothetical protein
MRRTTALCMALLGCDPTMVVGYDDPATDDSDAMTDPGSTDGGAALEGGTPLVVVERSGMRLMRGSEPFRFLGVNTYYLAGMTGVGTECDYHESGNDWQSDVNAYFDAASEMGATVVRFWAFQSYAGESGNDFTFLERLVAATRPRGIYLVPVLTHQWGNCEPEHEWLPDSFFATGYREPGYRTGYPLSYRDYVDQITAHFTHEPTILMWQMGHDLAMTQDFEDRVAIARDFTADIAALMKQNSPDTLVGIGANGITNGGFGEWDYTGYETVHRDPNVDVMSAVELTDDFPELASQDLSAQLELDWSIALQIEKPFFVYSGGVSRDETEDYVAMTHAKLATASELGFAGYLMRAFDANEPPQGFAFGNLPDDPLGALFRADRSLFSDTPYPPRLVPLPDCSVQGERGCDQTDCCDGLTCRELGDWASWLCDPRE